MAGTAPEKVDREKLKDALDDDAMNAYDEREQQLGEELMRHLERSILLQVIDNRWREHLYDMDYLREGIHLRGFAQIDPLVAYKNEGFGMFEELMHSIWEEFSKLVFHAEIEVQPGQVEGIFKGNGEPTALDYSGGSLEAQPSALQQVAAQGGMQTGQSAEEAAEAALGNGAPEPVETVVKDEHDKIGRNDPCWCGSGQEVQEVPWGVRRVRRGFRLTFSWRLSLSATVAKKYKTLHPRRTRASGLQASSGPARSKSVDPVREFIRAFNERDLDAFVAVLDPEVELHSMRGLRKGREAARLWATRPPGGVQQTIELEQLYEDEAAGQRHGGGAGPAPLELGRGRLGGGGRRDGLGLRAARRPGA